MKTRYRVDWKGSDGERRVGARGLQGRADGSLTWDCWGAGNSNVHPPSLRYGATRCPTSKVGTGQPSGGVLRVPYPVFATPAAGVQLFHSRGARNYEIYDSNDNYNGFTSSTRPGNTNQHDSSDSSDSSRSFTQNNCDIGPEVHGHHIRNPKEIRGNHGSHKICSVIFYLWRGGRLEIFIGQIIGACYELKVD